MKTGSDARCLTTGLTQSARLRIEAHEDFVFQEESCAEPRQLVCVCEKGVPYRVCSNMFDPSSEILYRRNVSECSEGRHRILMNNDEKSIINNQ